jgi:hypothetical protein
MSARPEPRGKVRRALWLVARLGAGLDVCRPQDGPVAQSPPATGSPAARHSGKPPRNQCTLR